MILAQQPWTHTLIEVGVGFFIPFMFLIVCLTAAGITNGDLHNPLGPLIRWIDNWQRHRYAMRELELKIRMRRDMPEYTDFLESLDKDKKKRAP